MLTNIEGVLLNIDEILSVARVFDNYYNTSIFYKNGMKQVLSCETSKDRERLISEIYKAQSSKHSEEKPA